jgi:hypothetical protein
MGTRQVDSPPSATYKYIAVNTRTRKTVAVICIAVVVFAAFLPPVAANLPPIILTALWLVIPIVVVVVIRRQAVRCDEQPVSLLSLVLSRAPPSHLAVA